MRAIRALLIYFVLVFLGGGLLAPWLYWLAVSLAPYWHGFAKLAANPFHRFVGRALLGIAFLGLWPLLRACEIRHWRDLGFKSKGHALANVAGGFLLGFGSLACVTLLAVCSGGRAFNSVPEASQLLGHITSATLSAIIVAFLEELLFRGALYGILRRITSWPMALVLSSTIYALAHFMQNKAWHEPVGWLSGLELLPRMFDNGPPLIPAAFTLFMAGAILAFAYQRTGTLFLSMGLHAGWIFWLKSYGFLTVKTTGASTAVWGTDKLVDGWLPLFVLCVVFWIVSRLKFSEAKPT